MYGNCVRTLLIDIPCSKVSSAPVGHRCGGGTADTLDLALIVVYVVVNLKRTL